MSFSDRVGVQAQVLLKMCDRGTHDQHSLTQLAQKKDTHASSCECPTITQTHVSSDTSRHDSNTQYPFSSSWVNECFQENLCVNPNSIRKRYPHLVFCIVALKVNLEDHFPWTRVHDFAVLHSFTRAHLHMSKKRRSSSA